jgi:lipoprotein-releasing system permease protein
MPLEWYVALRFLREGRAQSSLIVSGVAVGISVIVFLTALISGLQSSLIEKTLGTQPHVVVRPPDEAVRPLRTEGDARLLRIVERPAQRVQSIDEWPKVLSQIEAIPGVKTASPMVTGSAFAIRGTTSRSVALMGVEGERFTEVIPVDRHLVRGEYRIGGGDALIGTELADDLGVDVGSRIRVSTAGGRNQVLTVRGIFDLGNRDVNQRWVLSTIRSAQTLLDLVGGVSTIELTVTEIFDAEAVARAIEARTGLTAESWTERNSQLLTALSSQSASSTTIKVFIILAVAMGIASVLIVSVVQRSKQVGILRAMGMSRRSVLKVFLYQGLVVGLGGAAAGCLLGSAIALVFARLATSPDGSPLFPVTLDAELYLVATIIAAATGVLSAVLPARRAARLDPAAAIRQ